MRDFVARWARQGGLAILIALTTVATAAARDAYAPVVLRADDVTESDIAASNVKIDAAYGALVTMWSADFQHVGARFAAPGMVRFRGTVRTSCGIMRGNNAMYCPTRNSIYFDEVFVARQSKAAAREQIGRAD